MKRLCWVALPWLLAARDAQLRQPPSGAPSLLSAEFGHGGFSGGGLGAAATWLGGVEKCVAGAVLRAGRWIRSLVQERPGFARKLVVASNVRYGKPLKTLLSSLRRSGFSRFKDVVVVLTGAPADAAPAEGPDGATYIHTALDAFEYASLDALYTYRNDSRVRANSYFFLSDTCTVDAEFPAVFDTLAVAPGELKLPAAPSSNVALFGSGVLECFGPNFRATPSPMSKLDSVRLEYQKTSSDGREQPLSHFATTVTTLPVRTYRGTVDLYGTGAPRAAYAYPYFGVEKYVLLGRDGDIEGHVVPVAPSADPTLAYLRTADDRIPPLPPSSLAVGADGAVQRAANVTLDAILQDPAWAALAAAVGGLNEGSSDTYPVEQQDFVADAQAPDVRTICETGFNGGQSSLLWLLANPRARVLSFDILEHPYAVRGAQFLHERFPSRFHLTAGDSTKTLPAFAAAHPDVRCDLILVDGGHTYEIASADIRNFAAMAGPGSTVIVDDTPCAAWWCKEPGRAISDAEKEGLLASDRTATSTTAVSIFPAGTRGYTVGHYLQTLAAR